MMLELGLVILGAFMVQAALSMLQMKYFSKEFMKLRRQGRVACGRQAGGFRAGAIVMFQIDDDGIIRQARKMEGFTFLARVRPMEGFCGKYVGTLTGDEVDTKNKNLRRAVLDASLTYRKFVSGEPITPPPSPFQVAAFCLRNALQRKKAVE